MAEFARSRFLICFSHLRWDFVTQRPQHLITRAAREQTVVFFEEPIYRDQRSAVLDLQPRGEHLTLATPVLPWGMAANAVVAAQRTLLRGLLKGLDPLGRAQVSFWHYTPMALAFNAQFPCDLCIYDCMDELSAFAGADPELVAYEAKLFDRADLVFAGGRSLFEAKRARHLDVHLFPSSIDAAHFRRARHPSATEPPDQRVIPHPRIGFFGVIDERLDYDLLAKVAALRPDLQFVMLGPCAKIDPSLLPRAPNLHWLGPKAYRELPAYLAGWDAGLMPFALNAATRFISPTKTPEFLAAGLPLVSTPVADVVSPYGDNGLVEIASTPKHVAHALSAVLARPRAGWLTAVDGFLADMSWDRTWAGMRKLMDDKLAKRRTPRPQLPAPERERVAHV